MYDQHVNKFTIPYKRDKITVFLVFYLNNSLCSRCFYLTKYLSNLSTYFEEHSIQSRTFDWERTVISEYINYFPLSEYWWLCVRLVGELCHLRQLSLHSTHLSSSLQLDLLMSLQALILLFLNSNPRLGLRSIISGWKFTLALGGGEGSMLGNASYVHATRPPMLPRLPRLLWFSPPRRLPRLSLGVSCARRLRSLLPGRAPMLSLGRSRLPPPSSEGVEPGGVGESMVEGWVDRGRYGCTFGPLHLHTIALHSWIYDTSGELKMSNGGGAL